MIRRSIARLWNALCSAELPHRDASAEALGALRIWVFGIVALKLACDPIQDLSLLPPVLFAPHGVMGLVTEQLRPLLLSPGVLIAFRWIIVALAAMAAAGVFTRVTTVATAVLLFFHGDLVRGFGIINHSELPLLYAAAVLAAFPSGDGLAMMRPRSPARERRVYSLALVSLLALILLTYCFMGVHRLLYAPHGTMFSDTLYNVCIRRGLQARDYEFDIGVWMLDYTWLSPLLNMGWAVVSAFEIGAPLALFFRWFRIPFIVVMLSFHISVLFLMEIFFWELCLLYVLFLDLDRTLAILRNALGLRRPAASPRELAPSGTSSP